MNTIMLLSIAEEACKALPLIIISVYIKDSGSFHASKGQFENFSKQISLHYVKRIVESASVNHMAGAKHQQHFKKITGEKDYSPQQIFNPDETGLKFKHEMEAIMAPYKEVCKGTQKKAKQSKTILFFMKYSVSPSTMHPVIRSL
jgi:hypothetical protein